MKVFVSYRRSDTQDFAGRLADRLRETPGLVRVFIDVQEIAPGEVFPDKLAAALKETDVFLIVIGPGWCGPRAGTPARILDPNDFVRIEVRTALAAGPRCLPILANGADMPTAKELPDDLVPLVDLNALSIRHGDFDRDVDHLIDVIFQRRKPGTLRTYLDRHPIQETALRSVLGLCSAGAGLLVAGVVHLAITGNALETTVGGAGPVVLLMAITLLAGAALPVLASARRRRRRA